MEVLLIACMLAYAAGAQNEQSKLGLSPAQRAILREQVRHEKAVRKIAEKHGTTPPDNRTDVSPWKEPPAGPVTVPEAFKAAYRSHTPITRVATPLGRRAGGWAARGVHWAKDTGRSALREYRKRRRAAGEPDPAPVLIPPPPDRPPAVPPMPDHSPTVDTADGSRRGVSLAKPGETTEPDGGEKTSDGPAEPPTDGEGPTGASEPSTGPENAVDGLVVVPSPRSPEETAQRDHWDEQEEPDTSVTEPEKPVTEPAAAVTEPVPGVTADKPPITEPAMPVTEPATVVTQPVTGTTPASTGEERGVGRMAAEVSYDSVMDESDELSLMCDDDVAVYGRIRTRCEREIGRADDLIAQLESVGAGAGVVGWVTRCKEQYQVILGQLDDLERNTLAQGEAVVRAKALLEAGQGLYADIAADMESVADRDFYLSDQVDGEDTAAEAETYETQGARA